MFREMFSPYQWKNRVMIKFLDNTYTPGKNLNYIVVSHLRDDIALSPNTEFQSIIDMTPFGRIAETFKGFTSAFTGNVTERLQKYMQIEAWKSTDPLSIGFKLHLDTDYSAQSDVYDPALALLGYTVPEEKEGSELLKTPGPNFKSIGSALSQSNVNTASLSKQIEGRLVSLLIGGWLYFNNAVLTKAEPTFSKDLTDSGFPLFADIDCEIKTLATTTVKLLTDMRTSALSQLGDLMSYSMKKK